MLIARMGDPNILLTHSAACKSATFSLAMHAGSSAKPPRDSTRRLQPREERENGRPIRTAEWIWVRFRFGCRVEQHPGSIAEAEHRHEHQSVLDHRPGQRQLRRG